MGSSRPGWIIRVWSKLTIMVRLEFRRALALRSEIRHPGWFIHENALPVNGLLSQLDNEQSPKDNVHQSSIRAATLTE